MFIDFENLVYGVEAVRNGSPDDEVEVDVDALFRFARDEGRLIVARAYADWGNYVVRQHQRDLYVHGIEPVNVLGKGRASSFKNSVDVALAVDAVQNLYEREFDIFVLVSGDRDFMPLLRCIREHGKTIIGVAVEQATSADLAGMCDRFVYYRALWRAYRGTPEPSQQGSHAFELFKEQLRQLLEQEIGAAGIMAAALKPKIRSRIDSSFDQTQFGFVKFSALLAAMPDVVRVEHIDDAQGDVRVFPAESRGHLPTSELRGQTPPDGEARAATIDGDGDGEASSETERSLIMVPWTIEATAAAAPAAEPAARVVASVFSEGGALGVAASEPSPSDVRPALDVASTGSSTAARPNPIRITLPPRPPLSSFLARTQAKLAKGGILLDRASRVALLGHLYEQFVERSGYFSQQELTEQLEGHSIEGVELNHQLLRRHLWLVYQSFVFEIHPDDYNLDHPQRRLRLRREFRERDDFLKRIDQSLVHKAFEFLPESDELAIDYLCELLERDPQGEREIVRDLLRRVEQHRPS